MTTLDSLRARVLASPEVWTLLQADCAAEFPEGAVRAIRQRLDAAWDSRADLTYALRGEGKTPDEIALIIADDMARMDDLLAEDEKRAAAERRAADAERRAA